MRAFALVAPFLLAACTDPTLFGGIALSTEGVTIHPVLAGTVGGTTVSIQPN